MQPEKATYQLIVSEAIDMVYLMDYLKEQYPNRTIELNRLRSNKISAQIIHKPQP